MNELMSGTASGILGQAPQPSQPATAGWFAQILASLNELHVTIGNTDDYLAKLGNRTGFNPPPGVGDACASQAETPSTDTYAIGRKIDELRAHADCVRSRAAMLNEAL